jgi:putative acetyltransferase
LIDIIDSLPAPRRRGGFAGRLRLLIWRPCHREAAMPFTVRRAEPADYEGIWRNFSDESAYSGTLQLPFPSKEGWRERLAKVEEGNTLLVACEGDTIVGNAGLHGFPRPRRAHAASIGMSVPSEWQGRGVGTALMAAIIELADNWYGYARLELTVFTDNAAALALYRKSGFEVEGTLRAYALRKGALVDVHAMARLRPRAQPPA